MVSRSREAANKTNWRVDMSNVNYKVTFSKKDYVTNVLFNNAGSPSEAIESANLYNSNEYDDVRAERIGDDSEDGTEVL